ncbi:proline--tRNA ligase [Sphaerothrix gracilis]|uniref:proline--tRNA ligase n=1 Tax=Sphaerothrix gracilis TaxID=3151835 RepID=UPI0031FDAFDD
MRLSQMLFVTLREDPAEAEIPSHKLLLRAGYFRRITSGVYAYLPLLWRVLGKVSQIVREEMNATGAQECLLPQLQPADLWQESGRWETYTKAEGIMFSLIDRREQLLGLGPTHEEVITAIARDMIRSYRQLPLHLYQIQTKFRDEIRPRFGLMRGREFIMKDGYSFHPDTESLKQTYQDMYTAYSNILRRCGLAFRAVEADAGAIGGSAGSHEFMVLAEAGEDEVLYTEDGQYAANVEKAVSQPADAVASSFDSYEKLDTPNTPTIESLAKFLKCSPTQIVKNVLYDIQYRRSSLLLDFRLVISVSIRGDQTVNEVKLQNEVSKILGDVTIVSLQALEVLPVPEELSLEPLPVGYISPELDWSKYFQAQLRLETDEDIKKVLSMKSIGTVRKITEYIPSSTDLRNPQEALAAICEAARTYWKNLEDARKQTSGDEKNSLFGSEGLTIKSKQLENLLNQGETLFKFDRIVDQTAVGLQNFVTGSDESGYHVVGANWGEQFELPSHKVDVRKAQAGDRALHDPAQTLQTARGIEIGHIFQLGTKYSQALGATYTNEAGEEVPLVMGCYGVGVSRLAQAAVEQSYDKDGIIWPVAIAPYQAIVVIPNIADSKQVEAAEQLYADLQAAGIETLLDDRDERAGVKFKDADLIGIPFRVVTGRSLKDGKVEVVKRASHESADMPIAEVVGTLKQWIDQALNS